MDRGLYIAVFWLGGDQEIRVGRLGRFHFRKGTYLYVGTASRGLSARLERHGRKAKPVHWHIDYLSRRATMLGAIVIDRDRETECQLAASVARRFDRPVKGFGASDCRCPGHLFYTKGWL